MQLFCETSDIGSRPSVATIGFFDGVHRGHRYLIEQVCAVAAGRGLASSVVTLSLIHIFTFFVMLQFWNLFNARVFGTSDSAFKGISKSYGMELIILAILGGQILIVQFGGCLLYTSLCTDYLIGEI